MNFVGIVDRVIETNEGEEIAVILAEDEDMELNVPVDVLPDGVEEGTVLSLEVEKGNVLDAEIDEEAARGHRERVEEKMERLRDRGRESSERVE